MNTDPRIEAAAIALYVALFPRERTPEGWADVSGAWKKNYRDHATAALAAADKAATITTVEELDALPVGSVVLDRVDCCYRLYHDSTDDYPVWCILGEETPSSPRAWLPATVLHFGGTK